VLGLGWASVAVAEPRTGAATAARRGFDARRNSAVGGVLGQVQALVRLAFISADPLIGIQQENVDGHSKQVPQLIALGVI